MRKVARIAGVVALALAGCERDMRDMYDQNKPHPDGQAVRYSDGRDVRAPVEGTVARSSGIIASTSSGRAEADKLLLSPRQRLDRGRERYGIYCAPCHSPTGDGDGMVVRRGFPKPESFHTERQRASTDTSIDDAVTQGVGAMRPMGMRVGADDRAAIIAYIRALQLSQQAKLDELPADARDALERSSR